MTLDLLHNKIIKETLTEAFEKSVNDNLVPKLYALYGTSLEGIQLYEDYIKDEFIKDGYWYYPLTVIIGGVNAVLWIKWDISDSRNFEGGVPYAYVGEDGIDFLVADDVPFAFKNSLEGRATYFEGGYVKVNVITDAENATILAGKYSQTFIDEMTRQISNAIAKACGVRGIADSSIEIDIVFAPNTYMEHTSENVTYRRLLISAKGCAPRDFWIKWTRLDSALAFSVNDNVNSDNVRFELGEEVSQKIREKEYRFLVYGNSDKYRVAMGRKNVTEWRELIKRAVKRGELVKTTGELEVENHASEVSDKLSEILEKCGVTVPSSVSAEIRSSADEANEALRLAVLGQSSESMKNSAEENEPAVNSAEEERGEYSFLNSSELVLDDLTESEAADESKASSDGEFDFDKEHEQIGFDMPDGDLPELTMEDILEEFIPKSEPEEDEEYEQIEAKFDISDVDESEPVSLNITKNDDVPFDIDVEEENEPESLLITEELEKEEEDSADEVLELSEERNTETEEEPSEEQAEELTEENVEEKTDVAVSSAYTDDEIARLELEVANARRLLETERISRENAEARLESERIAKANTEAELERARLDKESVMGELEAERLAKEEAESKISSAYIAKETAENQINLERLASAELRAQIEKQKFAIEQVKKLLDEETNARKLAEAEADRLRAEFEPLQNENIRLVEAARVAEEACREAEEKCREHEEKLLMQIELQEKERAREKNLFAEAARQAKEESERYLAERKEAEEQRLREEERLEALRLAEEERIKREEELRAEKDRIEAEVIRRMAEAENRKRSIEERAREARIKMEERARANTEAKVSVSSEYAKVDIPKAQEAADVYVPVTDTYPETLEPTFVPAENVIFDAADSEPIYEPVSEPIPEPVINYTYTSKLVRLMFRNSVDPNITSRLHEMISFALAEFKKEKLYIKVKASTPDNTTVVLNFVKFPEEEIQLLIDIINYLGNSDLGIYKIILE